jgi:hypothetical protein
VRDDIPVMLVDEARRPESATEAAGGDAAEGSADAAATS